MKRKSVGAERRNFVRLDYTAPIGVKVCKKQTISNLLSGYTANISQSGLLCNLREKVRKNDILWLSFDRATLTICEELERNALIYQSGIIGKVVRVDSKDKGDCKVGIQFITREEKNLTHIFPKVHFLKQEMEKVDAEA